MADNRDDEKKDEHKSSSGGGFTVAIEGALVEITGAKANTNAEFHVGNKGKVLKHEKLLMNGNPFTMKTDGNGRALRRDLDIAKCNIGNYNAITVVVEGKQVTIDMPSPTIILSSGKTPRIVLSKAGVVTCHGGPIGFTVALLKEDGETPEPVAINVEITSCRFTLRDGRMA